jgi:hypothetical protein
MMSGRNWTPYEIEIILHHYGSRDVFPRQSAPLYGATIQRLRENGYFDRDMLATEKCRVFVELLLRTPEPRNIWVDPRDGKEIMQEHHLTEDEMRFKRPYEKSRP